MAPAKKRAAVVVNNAGNQHNALFEDLTEEDIEAVLAGHLKGAFFVTQPAYRWMKQQGYGRVIFTSSRSGVFGNPYLANYGAAKTGVIGLMRVLVQEAPPEIRINAIMPNAHGSRISAPDEERVDQDFLAKIMARGNAYADQMTPDYCATLLTWLASSECDVAGQTFSVLRGNYAGFFPRGERAGRWEVVASGDPGGDKALQLRADARVLAAQTTAGCSLEYAADPSRHYFLVPASGRLQVNGVEVAARDGVAISEETTITIEALYLAGVVMVETA